MQKVEAIFLHHNEGIVAPCNIGGFVMRRAEWKDIVRNAMQFYERYTDEEIVAYNEALQETWWGK